MLYTSSFYLFSILGIFQAYGGNTWPVHIYRGFFEARQTLNSMWRGNPVLTALVFGLPLGFLSIICYSVCCADILDADEDEASGMKEGINTYFILRKIHFSLKQSKHF